jgi:cholesterol oxidase
MNDSAGAGPGAPASAGERATAWISQGFEELLYKLRHDPGDDFDVVIVGSGYGGAVAAAELAGSTLDGKPVRVCVLERGIEYLPGMFPSRLADLATHVRFSTPGSAAPRGAREGLFDFRSGPDVCALVANGLGGGSLINAGVMEKPSDEVFGDERWPPEFRDKSARDSLYEDARTLLEVPARNTIELRPGSPPKKFTALKALSLGKAFRAASITVAMEDKTNRAGVALKKCKCCGDCATGCNYEAKESLDVGLLVEAARRGAEIYTGATVLRIKRHRVLDRWVLTVVHTDDKLRKRQRAPLELRARKVVLAAGTFGSTEILMRSRSDALGFSPRLGQRFSSNGDTIAATYRQSAEVNAVSDESRAPDAREVGPTITGMIDVRVPGKPGYVIEDLAIPGPLRRAFEEVVTTANAFHELTELDDKPYTPGMPGHDPCAVDARAIARSSVVAIMGDDGARGSLELVGDAEGDDDGDGAVRVRWEELRNDRLFQEQIQKLSELAAESGAGGRVIPNPLWQILPDRMKSLVDNKRGPLFTVHPLGGCAMGRDAYEGVVNHEGRVFMPPSASGAADFYDDLVVLDGSIVPASLGINPALTITALALRAVKRLVRSWNLRGSDGPGTTPLPARPEFQAHGGYAAHHPPLKTEVEFIERMSGKALLTGKDGVAIPCIVELTLPFENLPLEELAFPISGKPCRLEVCKSDPAKQGQLRVFKEDHWRPLTEHGASDDELDKQALLRARLNGTLTVLEREGSNYRERTCRARRAYLLNRGTRDLCQWIVERFQKLGWTRFIRGTDPSPNADPINMPLFRAFAKMQADTNALASRAGEVRRFEYFLDISDVRVAGDSDLDFEGGELKIHGVKRLTYARRSNPWRQLTQMTLAEFPGLQGKAVLDLDARFLARKRIPLFHIVGQQDQPSALVDLASLLAYFFRLLVNIHLWSFRRPETPKPREPQRLPGIIRCRLPRPSITEIETDQLSNGVPVCVRLTRYRPSNPRGLPIVMIHGYSASGTTFAHHAVRPNMAEYFCEKKRDVWILDLRTSSGMPTARYPWTFEDAALVDLPAAFNHIVSETQKKLDVVAHCMGAAMFSMVVLKAPSPGERLFREREVLPDLINRVVLSQIGPVVVMSPANTLRAYVLSYIRRFLPFAGYDFRVKPDPGLMDQLIDRLLASMPYPEEEFHLENPLCPFARTAFVGTRHRMDALYGRDFSLARKDGERLLHPRVLKHIDDLFGPLSIDTIAQGIHFARLKAVATPQGRNEYALAENMKTRWTFPTLSIHGEDNGLADVATLARIEDILGRYASGAISTHRFPGFGHQDSLIGIEAEKVFKTIARYLDGEPA